MKVGWQQKAIQAEEISAKVLRQEAQFLNMKGAGGEKTSHNLGGALKFFLLEDQ